MAFRQRTVTGTLLDGKGNPIMDATIEFNTTLPIGAIVGFLILDRPFTTTTNADGEFSIDLWCDEDSLIPINYRVTLPKTNTGQPDNSHTAVFSLVYDDEPIDIGTLVAMGTPPAVSEEVLYFQIQTKLEEYLELDGDGTQFLSNDGTYKTVSGGGGEDTTAPNMTTFSAVQAGSSQINVSYAATDNVAVTGFDLEWSANGTSGWTALLTNSAVASPYQHTGRTAATQYFYRGRARDAAGNISAWSTANATTQSSGDVSPTIVTTTIPSGTVGQVYPNTQIAVASGNTPITFEHTTGDLPPGISLSSLGVFSGTPTEEGTFSFGVRATDTDGDFDDQSFDLDVVAAPAGDTPIYNQLSATAQGMMRRLYSVRQAIDSYTGPAIRVKNTDTNTQTDLPLGFTKANVDALGTIDKIRIVKIYDQSGNADDFVFTTSELPRLEYLNRPMWDWSYIAAPAKADANMGGLSLTAPKIFYAIDTRVGSMNILSFYNIGSNTFNYRDSLGGQRFNQTGNAGTVTYDPMQGRGVSQMTSVYRAGDDTVRQNGTDLTKFSGTNATDAGLTVDLAFLGDLGGSGLPFAGRIGEILLFDGAIPDADRNLIESNQQGYFMDGNRLIMIGDSLAYGANLRDVNFNEKQDDWSVGAVTRNLLGDGWDVYLRALSGSAINHPTTATASWLGTGNLLDTRVPSVYRPSAANNVCVIWTGWNDVNGGWNYAQLRQHFIDLVTKIKTDYPEMKVVLCSMPIAGTGAPTGQGLATYLSIRASINSDMETGYNTIFGADAYADIASDSIIGDGADGSDATYWMDTLHMTAAGYARAATHIRDAVESIT